MGSIRLPRDVMLFSSIIYRHYPDDVMAFLEKEFGDTIYQSDELPFDYTNYYEAEMGPGLKRMIVAFKRLVPRDFMPEAKIRSNEIEDKFLTEGKRGINIDPGILSLENVCLATTKPYSHRIYLSRGIWAEVTLIYKGDTYSSLEWTYPDYASDKLRAVFKEIRNIYKGRLRCQAA
ncbi:MAG TPA: DUF4416 family protein [Desulfomonilia bacterium]